MDASIEIDSEKTIPSIFACLICATNGKLSIYSNRTNSSDRHPTTDTIIERIAPKYKSKLLLYVVVIVQYYLQHQVQMNFIVALGLVLFQHHLIVWIITQLTNMYL